MRISQGIDVTIVEIGGTVGDIESLPFLEAIRQMPYDVGRENVLYVHLTLVPYIGAAGELKTKPTQHSVNKLREIGIQPHILLCRTDRYLPPELKGKIAMFCNVEKDAVITAKDVETIYEVPIVFRKEGLDELIVRLLQLETGPPNLREWDAMVQKIKHPKHEVSVALVGKYAGLKECYKSLAESLVHGGIDHETRVNIQWIESEEIERQGTERILREVDGILVPGGFGARGIEGKIAAIRYAREHQIPFLGLCLGMQCATIEFARNVAGLADANSAEFDEGSPDPVIHLMSDQQSVSDKGGTMRLGVLCLCARGGHPGPKNVRGERSARAPSASVRIQQCVPRAIARQGIRAERAFAGRPAGRNHRVEGPSLVPRDAVPSGIQFAAAPSASVVQRVCGGGACAANAATEGEMLKPAFNFVLGSSKSST